MLKEEPRGHCDWPRGRRDSKRWHQGGSQGLEPQGLAGEQDCGFDSARRRNSLEGCDLGVDIHIFLFYPDPSGCFVRIVWENGSREKGWVRDDELSSRESGKK